MGCTESFRGDIGLILSRLPIENQSICRTPACVLAAAEILHSVSSPSRNIDPCTNFRIFACSGWDSRNYLSDDQARLSRRLSRRSALTGATQSLLRQILESKGPSMSTMTSEGAAKKRIFTKMQKAYRSCMDEARIDQRGLMPLVDLAGWYPKSARHRANLAR